MTLDLLRDRITSVCAGDPFGFTQADVPWTFDGMPTGTIDGGFRVTSDVGPIRGWTNFSEERTDPITIWLARKQTARPEDCYRKLVTDASSLRAAVIRDGVGGGDFDVPDGPVSGTIQAPKGAEYAVLRLTLPINYETSV